MYGSPQNSCSRCEVSSEASPRKRKVREGRALMGTSKEGFMEEVSLGWALKTGLGSDTWIWWAKETLQEKALGWAHE